MFIVKHQFYTHWKQNSSVPLLPSLFSPALEVFTDFAIKEKNNVQKWQRNKIEVSLFPDDMFLFLENSSTFNQKMTLSKLWL